jgi:hypothetical protein
VAVATAPTPVLCVSLGMFVIVTSTTDTSAARAEG